MKKLLCLALTAVLFLSLVACGETEVGLSSTDTKYVTLAVKEVLKAWKNEYKKAENGTDNTVGIFNTRLIKIRENDDPIFQDVDAVVEFDIYTDLYGSAPYYLNLHTRDSVVFYKNGKKKVENLFAAYTTRTYSTDYSDFIGEVIELKDTYNTIVTSAATLNAEEEDYMASAVACVEETWASVLASLPLPSDGTLRIINSRLLFINPGTSPVYEKYFSGVKAVVEFELYTDYYSSAPYYVNAGRMNTVLIAEDGTAQLSEYTLKDIAVYIGTGFGDLFSDVYNLGEKYNETRSLLP